MSSSNPTIYRNLTNYDDYSCAKKNETYSGFHNGNNCLCSRPYERSNFDEYMIQKWGRLDERKDPIKTRYLNTKKK